MKVQLRTALGAAALALLGAPWAGAQAQDGGWLSPSYNYRLQYYLGASIGAGLYPDDRGNTASWLNSSFSASNPQASGNYIGTFARQDSGAFAGKVYGGAWITPHLAVELGWTSLGRINWNTYSTNVTGSFAAADSGQVAPHAWYESLLLAADGYGMRYFAKLGAYEASTDLQAGGLNLNTGAAFGGSQTVNNTGALVGLGLHTGWGHTAVRLELEDFIDVGNGSQPLGSAVPPWHGSIWLLSAGLAYLF